MSIIVVDGHRETAEVEFAGRHPDIFSTFLAAYLVERLAEESDKLGYIHDFRADLFVLSKAVSERNGNITPIEINIGGQVVIPQGIDLEQITLEATKTLLEGAGYFKDGDFSPQHLATDIRGITSQSPILKGVSSSNKFADFFNVYGHYLDSPFGISGAFPSLIIAKRIDNCLDDIIKNEIDGLRPDGKVYVTIKYTKNGFFVEDVGISIAHQKGINQNFKSQIKDTVIGRIKDCGIKDASFSVNSGGDFYVYFLQADGGMSKAKDDVVITGGLHQLGTDKVWGKCLYKPSSIAIPYAFALSRAVCEALGAKYASVNVHAKYGQDIKILEIWDIDPRFEQYRNAINQALDKLPKDRSSIMEILGFEVNLNSYKIFNDVGGFHSPDKPWKRHNPELNELFLKSYKKFLEMVF